LAAYYSDAGEKKKEGKKQPRKLYVQTVPEVSEGILRRRWVCSLQPEWAVALGVAE
jgi:hypothetical protein